MKWSYRLIKIGRGYHICEVYVDKRGEPLPNILYAIDDRLSADRKLPQWVIKDLFQKPLEFKNHKLQPYELRSKKTKTQ